MINRDQFITDFRGETLGTVHETSSVEEKFQNETLRPILKLQNDLFLELFRQYFIKTKNTFYTVKNSKKPAYIDQIFQTDIKFMNLLRGVIIGLLRVDEYIIYANNTANINRRITTLLSERIRSQIHLFDSSYKVVVEDEDLTEF